jgi:hypothetical protein
MALQREKKEDKKDQEVLKTQESVGTVQFSPEGDDEPIFPEVEQVEIVEGIDGKQEEVIVVESQEENPTTEQLMPKSEVEKLLSQQREMMMKDFEKMIKKQPTVASPVVEKSYTQELLDDYLETPVVFFAYSSDFFLGGDFRNGREVIPPLRDEKIEGRTGVIRFEQVIRQIRRTERSSAKVICVSVYKCFSKKELEFLENHSLFGVRFFREMDSSKNVDSRWATKLTEANASIARLSEHRLIEVCEQNGIPKSKDVNMMRRKLIDKLAKQLLAQEQKIQGDSIEYFSGFDQSGDGAMRHIIHK